MLKNYLEEHGHKVFQTDLFELIPFINSTKFDLIQDADNHSYAIPVENNLLVEQALNSIHLIIANEYLYPYASYVEFLHKRIWKGIAINSDKWHNDSNESVDIFFLLYFNDMTKSNTGAFLIKDELGTVKRIVPTLGTLIAVDNTIEKFFHRAEYTTEDRIVASFNFKVKWI
jgi:hypothetical protein